jgi:hypothetical protein
MWHMLSDLPLQQILLARTGSRAPSINSATLATPRDEGLCTYLDSSFARCLWCCSLEVGHLEEIGRLAEPIGQYME